MRVLLVHNPTAGDEHPDRQSLVKAFEAAGHRVTYRSSKDDDWTRELGTSLDVVVAAGGDGTVRAVTTQLARSDAVLPFTVLPLGTANNIARTLGIDGTPADLARRLTRAESSHFSVGMAKGAWGSDHFVEAAGVGIFPEMLRIRMVERKNQEVEERMESGIRTLRQMLEAASPRTIHLDADGVDLSGEYFLVEAMNIASIGACVDLAPGADYTGDALDLVLIGPAERPLLLVYLDGLLEGNPAPVPLERRRAQRITVGWPPDLGHLDDELWPEKGGTASEVTLAIGAVLPLLLPQPSQSQ
jgi:diacylglycerol kinase family enzyme